MNIIIPNEKKMRSYMSKFMGSRTISDEDFDDWIGYLKWYAGCMYEDVCDMENKVQGANLTFTPVDEADEEYYINVIFDFTDPKNVIVDLDYNSEVMDEYGTLMKVLAIITEGATKEE